MDPNSQHQLWSVWTWTITPKYLRKPSYEDVKSNCARFARKAFGSPSEMNIEEFPNRYRISVRTEGHPAHDPAYVRYMKRIWNRFFINGFGIDCEVSCDVKVEAGDKQDGKPKAQTLWLPQIPSSSRVFIP